MVVTTPLVNFSINQSQQCINNQQFDFTNRTIVPGSTGSISYLWNLGDSATSTQTNLSKKYAYYGSKQVLLKATSVAGCWDTASQWIVVQPKPSAKFAINNDTQCVSTNQYNFTNQTTLVSGPWSIKNQAWNFGDGGFGATTSNATKKYNNFGSYSVRLIVTTSFGCADTTYQPVRVHPMPKVSYSVNNANQCLVGNDFQFSNTTSIVSGGGNITYQWKFGNGATTTNTNPSYSYASANTYAVRLIATSQFGCRDSITTNVKAVANPSVNFTINNLEISFVNSAEIIELNKKYLNHKHSTDIITFDYSKLDSCLEGEILISLDDAITNSKRFGTSSKEELLRLVTHGVLHLLGYKDEKKNDKKIMKMKENLLTWKYKYLAMEK
jgi:rRNA maturation RNase YbeY